MFYGEYICKVIKAVKSIKWSKMYSVFLCIVSTYITSATDVALPRAVLLAWLKIWQQQDVLLTS